MGVNAGHRGRADFDGGADEGVDGDTEEGIDRCIDDEPVALGARERICPPITGLLESPLINTPPCISAVPQ